MTLEELVRKIVGKIPANVYGILLIILAVLDIVYLNQGSLGVALPDWAKTALGIAHAAFLFLRPVSSSDEAIQTARELARRGDTRAANEVLAKKVASPPIEDKLGYVD